MSIQTTYLDRAPLAYAGVIAEPSPEPPVSAFNTDAVEIPFGHCVARDNTAPYDVSGNGAKLPAAGADTLMGIVRHSHAYLNSPNGDLGTTGLKPGAVMSVQRKGRIWAACEDGCVPGNRLFVRYTAAGTGKGSLRATDTGGSTGIDATTKAEWQTKAAALGLAILEIDFTNK